MFQLYQSLNVDYRIWVAGFKFKADAIYGALKGKFINTIIIDKDAALNILERQESNLIKVYFNRNIIFIRKVTEVNIKIN